MAREPSLVIKNQKALGARFNDPVISAGFTGAGFPAQPPKTKASSPSLECLGAAADFIKVGNKVGKVIKNLSAITERKIK